MRPAAVQASFGGSQWDDVEQHLRAMGFDDHAAVHSAVRESHGDMDAALELLLAGV